MELPAARARGTLLASEPDDAREHYGVFWEDEDEAHTLASILRTARDPSFALPAAEVDAIEQRWRAAGMPSVYAFDDNPGGARFIDELIELALAHGVDVWDSDTRTLFYVPEAP